MFFIDYETWSTPYLKKDIIYKIVKVKTEKQVKKD